MNVYVKETTDFSINKVKPLLNSKVKISPLISIDELSCNDLIIVSREDSTLSAELNEYYVVIYEALIEEISRRVILIYRNNHDYYYLKNALNQAKDSNIETLITGSSYGSYGIDLSYFNNAVNLSSISQDLYYSQKLVLQACQNNNVKNIVFCVGYYCFYNDLSLMQSTEEVIRISKVYYPLLHDAHNCLFLPSKEDYIQSNDVIDFDSILESFALEEYRKGFFTDVYPMLYCETKVWSDKTKQWCELSEQEKNDAGKIRAELHNKSIKHTMTLKENMLLFQNLVAYCNKKGINLIFVVTPMTKQYLSYLNPKFKDDFYNILDKTDGNVHLLDLASNDAFDNDADFNDTDHLNDLGSAKLSSIISTILKEIQP